MVRAAVNAGEDPRSLQYPPIMRPEASPAASGTRFPAIRVPRDVRLSTIALASGLALAIEGVRFMRRSMRQRSEQTHAPESQGASFMSYQWTRIIYERYERS